MRRVLLLASLLGAVALGLGLPGSAPADSFSLGVQTESLDLGIRIGPTPPALVAVPPLGGGAPRGTPSSPSPRVYTAPTLPYNYFVYQRHCYLYHEGHWFRGRQHTGPWKVISIAEVPPPVLAVPVEQYKVRPRHWARHGRPPWAREREQERERHGHRERRRGHERGRDEPHR